MCWFYLVCTNILRIQQYLSGEHIAEFTLIASAMLPQQCALELQCGLKLLLLNDSVLYVYAKVG